MANERLSADIADRQRMANALREKVSGVDAEKANLATEKTEFENAMMAQMAQMERELEGLREQLRTKDEVLKRQIAQHEGTKVQFRRKIEEYSKLKQQNENTLWLLKGDNEQHRDMVGHFKKDEKGLIEEMDRIHIEMEQIKEQSVSVEAVEQWIFDYGDGGHFCE